MFATFRPSNSVVYATNEYFDRVSHDKKKLMSTKKSLQTTLQLKLEKVKKYVECDPFENKLTTSCIQMWDEIEELSSALHDIKLKLEHYDDDNVIKNTNMLNAYYIEHLKKNSLDL